MHCRKASVLKTRTKAADQAFTSPPEDLDDVTSYYTCLACVGHSVSPTSNVGKCRSRRNSALPPEFTGYLRLIWSHSSARWALSLDDILFGGQECI